MKIEEAIAGARVRRALPAPKSRRALRQAAGISQEMVANALHVSRPTVSRYESGTRQPSPQVAARYLVLLDRLRGEVL